MELEKALNQLVAVLSGREIAQATDHLKTNPHERIREAVEMAQEEIELLKEREEANGRKADTRQSKRKLSSLRSLLRLSEELKSPPKASQNTRDTGGPS